METRAIPLTFVNSRTCRYAPNACTYLSHDDNQQITQLQPEAFAAGSVGLGTVGLAASLARFDVAPAPLTSVDIQFDLC